MAEVGPITLGILLLILGSIFSLMTLFLLRAIPRLRSSAQSSVQSPPRPQNSSHKEAVLLIQEGGRVAYLNPVAHQWFNLWEEEPNLERLARRARPSEDFMRLCASESQARLSLDGRFVEGTSYLAPYGAQRAMLISLRQSQWLVEEAVVGENLPQIDASRQIFGLLSELSKEINASLDLEATLQAVLEAVERLIPFDVSEVNIWEPDRQRFSPFRLVGERGSVRRLDKTAEFYAPGQGYTGHLAEARTPLLVEDVDSFREVRPAVDRQRIPFRSYLGAPLLWSAELIGTLELISFNKNSFTSNDLEILRVISGYAAVAVHNALQFQAEQKRARELAGLANLAQAIGALNDSQDLYARLVESIATLLDAEVLGFLIYDEGQRVLQAKAPFLGLPEGVVAWYHTDIPPDSPAEEIWQMGEVILSNNAPEDERLENLGVHHLIQAAGISHTVLTPLISAGRMLGYLQIGDKRDGSPFDQDDLRLAAIIATQAAPIIENASLIQESRHRAQRAETLRRVASLSGSNATLDEILKFSLLDLARLILADVGLIYLLDEDHGELRLHKDSLFGIPSETAGHLGRFPTDNPQFSNTVTGSKAQFVSGRASETGVAALYDPLEKDIQVESIIAVPLISRERGIGEIFLGSFERDFFTSGDTLSAVTVASQLAAAIERSQLYSQTDQNLRQRVEQLTALTRVSREINTTLNLDHLLQRVYDEVLRTTRADCGTILLFELDETRSSPTSPQVMLHLGDPPGEKLHSLEKWVLKEKESLIVDDFSNTGNLILKASAHRTEIEEDLAEIQPAHEGICSALIVPIAYQGQVAGLIHLHARNPDHFSTADREISETLAIQAAIALGNAQRFQEQLRRSELLNRRVETLSRLVETSHVLQSDESLEESLESIAYAIQNATPFDIVLISVYNDSEETLQHVSGAGITLQTMGELRQRAQSWKGVQTLLKLEFKRGDTYFIPHEKMPAVPEDLHTVKLLSVDPPFSDESAWHPEDMLLMPLISASGQPLGLISVDAPRDNLRPDRATIETLEIFGSQAAIAIENRQRVSTLTNQVSQIQRELESLRQETIASQGKLSTLSQEGQEQALAIQHLGQRSQRIQVGLEIAESVNRKTSRQEVLNTLGQEILERMQMDVAFVAELGTEVKGQEGPNSSEHPSQRFGIRIQSVLGSVPPGLNPEVLLGQRNPLRHSLLTGETLLVADLETSPEWQNISLLDMMEARAFICLPVLTENQPPAAVLGISRSTLAPFAGEDQQLYHLLGQQASLALKNIALLEETGRRLQEVNLLLAFSRQLGSLDPDSILISLAESAVEVLPAAQAALVTRWDPAQELLVPKGANGYANVSSILEITFRSGEALLGQVFQEPQALRVDEIDFARHYALSPEKLMKYRDATAGRSPVSGMVIPILGATQSQPLGMLMLENFNTPAAFSDEDQALISSLAQQTALALENAGLYQASEQRARQLQTLTDVAAIITSSLRTDELIATLLNQMEAVLPYDTGTLWLRQGKELVVRAAHGFKDSDQRVGLSVAIEDSQLLKEMLVTGQAISVANVKEDQRFPALMEYERLSWLGVPLIASAEVIGVIALEKTEANYYTPELIQSATTFAGQAAVGLQNAALYQEIVRRARELDQSSQILVMLNRLSIELSRSLDIGYILGFASQEIFQMIHCSSISSVLFDQGGNAAVYVEFPATTECLPQPLPEAPLYHRLRQTLGVFISEEAEQEDDLAPLADFLTEHKTRSLLTLPLVTGSELHGLLLAHSDHPYRFEPDEVELARTISNQVAVAVQNARLFAETRSLTEDLELRVEERTSELAREHRRTETLLRIITELSSSLDLDQVLNRTLRVLNEMIDAEQITVMIARPEEKHLHRLASIGYTTPVENGGSPTPFGIDQGLAGWVYNKRQRVMIDDLLQDSRWVQISGVPMPQHRSAIAVPLMIGAEALGSLLLFHPQTAHFSQDQLELVQAAGNQVAVAVNNAELYRLIRDQAEDLGAMLRNQQIENSRSRAILEAVADGVLVTDSAKTITLFNASAEKILGLERSKVIGKSLEYFTGLFGKAAQAWRETISTWSHDPTTYQSGDTYAEQIILENSRVVEVRLAPVSMRNDFLGTVSIFQDITHQVEVDRLKSEFVATVSHELRTPMTSIKGYAEILLMGAAGQLNEQQTQFLDIVKMNTERLAVLVNDLLDISRIESGKVTLSMLPLSLGELVDEVINDLKHRALEEDKPVEVTKNVPADLPRVLGDRDRVRQILANLVDNAYHYNQPGGRIDICMQPVDGFVQIDVQDNGMGIPQHEQARVFERFFRGEGPLVMGVSGTGLGLSIVQNLVHMHKGQIWLESSGVPGEGSKFSFTLPQYLPEE